MPGAASNGARLGVGDAKLMLASDEAAKGARRFAPGAPREKSSQAPPACLLWDLKGALQAASLSSAWEVAPAHPSGLFIPNLFLGGAAAGPGGAQGSGTARVCRAGETDAFLGGKSFYPKETTPRKAPLPTGKLCTCWEAEILKRRT